MSDATPAGRSERRPGPTPARGKVLAVVIGIVTLLLILAALWFAWQRWRDMQGTKDQRARLQAAVDRGRTLAAELASIKPANAPECPPGYSLKTFAPGSQLPPLTGTPASAPKSSAASGPAVPATQAGAATLLPDFALAQRLEQVTAMVLVDDRGKLSGGTGFFVAPTMLVTNRHVVGGAGAQLLLVSKSLGSPRRATLLKVSEGQEFGAADFALVRMDDGTAPAVVEVTTGLSKLSPVVAAGYPAVVIKDDPSFKRFLGGDTTAAPDLNLTQGAVRSLQTGAGGLPVVVHTASIAKGNSGGPLVDACGRVVGVNTYISVDKEQSEKINYALRSEGMVGFLTSVGITAQTDARSCGARQ